MDGFVFLQSKKMAVTGHDIIGSGDGRTFYEFVVFRVLNDSVERARKVHKTAIRADVAYCIVCNIRRKEELGFQLSPDFVKNLAAGEGMNEISTSCVQAPIRRSAPKNT